MKYFGIVSEYNLTKLYLYVKRNSEMVKPVLCLLEKKLQKVSFKIYEFWCVTWRCKH